MTVAGPEAEALDARPAALSFGPLADILGFHIARAAVTTQDNFERHIGTVFELNSKRSLKALLTIRA